MKQYPDYLVHFNKNHSKANGQFVSGDGDGDGQVNDHAQRSEASNPKRLMTRQKARRVRNSGIALIAASAGLQLVNVATYTNTGKEWVHDAMAGVAAAGTVVGLTQTIRGAVSMGKASRRGDHS